MNLCASSLRTYVEIAFIHLSSVVVSPSCSKISCFLSFVSLRVLVGAVIVSLSRLLQYIWRIIKVMGCVKEVSVLVTNTPHSVCFNGQVAAIGMDPYKHLGKDLLYLQPHLTRLSRCLVVVTNAFVHVVFYPKYSVSVLLNGGVQVVQGLGS